MAVCAVCGVSFVPVTIQALSENNMKTQLIGLMASILFLLSFQQVNAQEIQRGVLDRQGGDTHVVAQDAMTTPSGDSLETININTASAAEIAQHLKGVGPAKAAAVVAFRQKNGPFLSLEEVQQVKGLGEKTLAKNQAVIRFE